MGFEKSIRQGANGKCAKASTTELRHSVLRACESRGKDNWATTVLGRMNCIIPDLNAADAVYRKSCYASFKTNKSMPKRYKEEKENDSAKAGRPAETKKREASEKFLEHFKSITL